MKHLLLILVIISVVVTGIFLPYLPGEYDYFAVGISGIVQLAAFTSLLLVPVGLAWLTMDLVNNRKNLAALKHPIYFRITGLIILALTILAAALGAVMTHNRFSAIIILLLGIYAFRKIANRLKRQHAVSPKVLPLYFIIVPLTVFMIRICFLRKAKDHTTSFVIEQSAQLVQDIEAYKIANGYYPVSLLSTIEDYKPLVAGIDRFHYERSGNAYNIYFEQLSDIIGTQEIIMYNKLDEQEMTVHNQDLLRIPTANIFRGYHEVKQLPVPHCKIFYFD